MASMKTMLVSVFDVGVTMNENLRSGTTSKRRMIAAFLSRYTMQRMMASKTVEVGVVTFGSLPDSKHTNNFLNRTTDRNGYLGVQEVVEMGKPNASTLLAINSIADEEASSVSGDLIDGIIVAQDILIRSNHGKSYNRVMLIFTDGEAKVEGVEDLTVVINQIKLIPNFAVHIFLLGRVNPESSVIKCENEKLLKSIASSVNGNFTVVESIADCFFSLSSGLGLGTRPRVSKINLEISPSLQIPCALWTKISEAKLPSLKKEASGTKGARAARDDDEDGGAEDMAGAVKRDTTYRNPNDPDQELGADEKVKGYRYGPQYIPMTAVDEKMFKVPGSPCLKLIGFMPNRDIPRHHYLDMPILVHGGADSEDAKKAIIALAIAMDRDNKVALARYVKAENADPYLCGLFPFADEEVGWSLLLYRLPCCEDVREYAFPSFNRFADDSALSSEDIRKKALVNQFVDEMTLPEMCLTPVNPVLHTLLAEVHRRIIDIPPSQVIPVDNPMVSKVQVSSAIATALKTEFKLTKVDQKVSGKKKVFWSDIDLSTSASGAAADGKKMKYEIDVQFLANNPQLLNWGVNVAEQKIESELSALPVFTAGSVNPIEDFQALISAAIALSLPAGLSADSEDDTTLFARRKKEVLEDAMKIMTAVIDCTIGCSTNAYYRRAVACLAALRSAAVTLRSVDIFNTFLRDTIKLQYSIGRHKMVWQMLVDEKLTLISSREVAGSSISPEEASRFFVEDKVEVVEEKTTVADDDDDLFGIMA